MSAFDDLAEIRPLPIWEGVLARSVDGERLTLAVIELDPGAVVAEHRHENEQLGMVIRGSVSFRVGGERRALGPGGTWSIPANTPHEVVAGADGAVVLDVFSPGRDDWKALDRGATQTPVWPS